MLAFGLRPRGIAAIELVALVAVTAVMLALAVSTYRTYAGRREVSASLQAVAPLQALVTHAFRRTGIPPISQHDVPGFPGLLEPYAPIQAVAIENGRIAIRFSDEANGGLRRRVLHVTPFETIDGQVVWICGNSPDRVGLHSLGFLGGTNRVAELSTTIDRRYLPAECR